MWEPTCDHREVSGKATQHGGCGGTQPAHEPDVAAVTRLRGGTQTARELGGPLVGSVWDETSFAQVSGW